MAKKNVPLTKIHTHEGGVAHRINYEQQLRRSVMSCLLWEREFYEDGVTISDRIKNLIPQVDPQTVAGIAIEAREKMKLRHAPLLIVREMARDSKSDGLVSDTLGRVVQRADELGEFMSIYWMDGRQALSGQVKKGLAKAFTKFDAYQIAKYNQDNAIKLRDVLFLTHAKASNEEQGQLWKRLIGGYCERCWLPMEKSHKHPERPYCKHRKKTEAKLAPPDTWEVKLSECKTDVAKRGVWEALLQTNKLGAMALLRNLRNMQNVGVDEELIIEGIQKMNTSRVLPFRFISSAKYAPQFEPQLEEAMCKCLTSKRKLKGKTIILVDVSGSMEQKLSEKSELMRMDAACGVAMLCRELCERVDVYSFSGDHFHPATVQVPARRGFALRDAIVKSQPHSGTYLGEAVKSMNSKECDRLIVITDEQATDRVGQPKGKGYMINVASNKNGVGYGNWIHIDGWSEAVLDYITAVEYGFDGNVEEED